MATLDRLVLDHKMFKKADAPSQHQPSEFMGASDAHHAFQWNDHAHAAGGGGLSALHHSNAGSTPDLDLPKRFYSL